MADISIVKTEHPDYARDSARAQMMDDVIESRVKQAGKRYLPVPGQLPQSMIGRPELADMCAQIDGRYLSYLFRAMFYNFTGRTLNACIGAMFRSQPTVELPPQIEYLIRNTDGAGLTLNQQAQGVANMLWRHGRAGLLADMPATTGPVSMADNASGRIAPRIYSYNRHAIINWRTRGEGSATVLSLVVLREHIDDDSVLYVHNKRERYRVLLIDADGYYQQEVYTQSGDGWAIEAYQPRQNGQRMRYIPFTFIGSVNNDPAPDPMPLYDLAEVNLGHYRNSADLEESAHIVGSPTLVVAPSEQFGPEAWREANPTGVMFGSRTSINVGPGGSAQILQAHENNLARQLMLDKEQQAIAIGAQLIAPKDNQTAEAAAIQAAADTSVMATIASNIESAYLFALQECAKFMAADPAAAVFQMPKDFYARKMTPQERQQWAADVMADTLPRTLYYQALRRSGDVPNGWTDADIAAALEAQGMTGGMEA